MFAEVGPLAVFISHHVSFFDTKKNVFAINILTSSEGIYIQHIREEIIKHLLFYFCF